MPSLPPPTPPPPTLFQGPPGRSRDAAAPQSPGASASSGNRREAGAVQPGTVCHVLLSVDAVAGNAQPSVGETRNGAAAGPQPPNTGEEQTLLVVSQRGLT